MNSQPLFPLCQKRGAAFGARSLLRGLLSVALLAWSSVPVFADSYSIPLPAGLSLIANQLDNGGNTLNEVLPNVAEDSSLLKWDCASQSFLASAVFAGGMWLDSITGDPSTETLAPGEGAYLFNPGPSGTLTFTGTPHVPVLPPPMACGCGKTNILSRQTNDIGTFENIMGVAPVEGAWVQRFVGGANITYTFSSGAWAPSVPTASVGEALFIWVPTVIITSQPASITVPQCPATNVTFTVSATGNGLLSYQWLFNGQPISGATSASYQITPVNATNAGNYTVKVTDSCSTVTSAPASLTVIPTVVIRQQPANATFAPCSNSYNVTFTVAATGNGPLTYQWLFNGQQIPGATSSSYEILSVNATNAGSYSVKISDSCSTVVSAPASLTAGPSVNIVSQPASATVTACTNIVFSVVATGSGSLHYQWFFNGQPIPGATNASYAIPSVNATNVGFYYVEVGDSCSMVTSALAWLTGENLVINGSFEVTLPPVSSNSVNNALNPATGIPGWTTTPNDFLEVWSSNFGFPPSVGTNQLEINAQSANQTVWQVVSNLNTNCPATFCFDYTGRNGFAGDQYNNEFTLILSGAHSLSMPLNPAPYAVGGWHHYCTSFIPAGPTLTISFAGMPHAPIAAGAHIDNVALTQMCPATIIACPPDMVMDTAPGQCSRVVNFTASATDNCGSNYVVNCAPASGSAFPVGVTPVICTATGTTNSCSFTVTVRDAERPTISCPSDIVVCADPGQSSKSNLTYVVTVTDNCPGVSLSCNPPSGNTFAVGTTPVSCVAVDSAGNSNRCSFAVQVFARISVVPLANLTRCRGDSATFTAVTSGGGAINYSWSVDNIPVGTDSPLATVATSGLTDGNHTVQCVITGECGSITNLATLTVQSCAEGGPCSFTQGFYGNANGKFNGTRSITLISNLLATSQLVVGKTGVRSLIIPQSDVPLLQQRMPSGGTAAVLPLTGNHLITETGAVPLSSKNKFDNILLGQTITLSLNVRLAPTLLAFQLQPGFCTQGVSAGPDGSLGTTDDVPVAGDIKSFSIPASVLAALTNPGLGINNTTVFGLLELANRALANMATGGASLPDINAAVDAINRGFDVCRVLVNCNNVAPSIPSPYFAFSIFSFDGGDNETERGASVASSSSTAAQILRLEGFNCDAIKGPGEPDIAGNPGGKPLWWQWQATASGLVTLQTAGSSFDTLLGVYVGPSRSNGTLVASSDDTSQSVMAALTFPAMAGTEYMLVVDGFDGACGNVVLEIVTQAPRLREIKMNPGGQLLIRLDGESGQHYLIEGSSDLFSWEAISVARNGTGVLEVVHRRARTAMHQFYRVVVEP